MRDQSPLRRVIRFSSNAPQRSTTPRPTCWNSTTRRHVDAKSCASRAYLPRDFFSPSFPAYSLRRFLSFHRCSRRSLKFIMASPPFCIGVVLRVDRVFHASDGCTSHGRNEKSRDGGADDVPVASLREDLVSRLTATARDAWTVAGSENRENREAKGRSGNRERVEQERPSNPTVSPTSYSESASVASNNAGVTASLSLFPV